MFCDFVRLMVAQKCFPNLASFRQVDAESEIAFSKKDDTFQESQGILSPLRLPVPPRPLPLYLKAFCNLVNECFARNPSCFAKQLLELSDWLQAPRSAMPLGESEMAARAF